MKKSAAVPPLPSPRTIRITPSAPTPEPRRHRAAMTAEEGHRLSVADGLRGGEERFESVRQQGPRLLHELGDHLCDAALDPPAQDVPRHGDAGRPDPPGRVPLPGRGEAGEPPAGDRGD